MKNQLLTDFISDIKVESVKIQFQICVPYSNIQYNPILGIYFDYHDLDGAIIIGILGRELKQIENLLDIEDYLPLILQRYNHWKITKLRIQDEGYNDASNLAKSEAYAYVFLTRLLRKFHKELYDLVKNNQLRSGV